MSQNLKEIFEVFKSKFPPVEDPKKARLKLTSAEIRVSISDLDGSAIADSASIYELMKDNGYVYVPEEINERVVFFWLIGE